MTAWMGRKLSDFGKLWPAEKKLIAEMGSGAPVEISSGPPPEGAPRKHRIRASFIRYLALGGCEAVRVPDIGVTVFGAYIEGNGPEGVETKGLNLEGCTLPGDLGLIACRFPDAVVMRGARIASLYLDGAHLAKGLRADGLEARGGVLLRGVVAKGEVQLLGVKLGGNLECDGAQFATQKGANGKSGSSLSADGARVEGAFFWRNGARATGTIDLTAARFGSICDDPACWPRPGDLLLNRCEYDAFTGKGISGHERIRWLALQDPARWGDDFWPQPYEQCAKVLREMGHQRDASMVLNQKERLQRRAERAAMHWTRRLGYWVGDGLLDATIRYGRQPLRASIWLFRFWLLGTVIFFATASQDALKPNSTVVLRSAEWALCAVEVPERVFLPSRGGVATGRAAEGQSQMECFLAQPEARSYPRFNAGIYSADTLLPIVDLEMQGFWIPDDTTPSGAWARVYLWIQIAAGWGLSLLAVAGFSGLVKSD